ncbi:MAG: septum formation initiator family protein [Pyrinomonadaceae bacterium]
MSRVVNTYWVDERIRSQRIPSRAVSPLAPVREISLELIGSRADIRRRGGVIPSWVIFGMIMLATFAVCATVMARTRTRMNIASDQYVKIQTDVQALRSTNDSLRLEVEQLRNNPRAIESAARMRLNMVRDNEILVPIE